MVACVSLMYDTHTRGGRGNGYSATACGLCVEDEHLPVGLFADAADVTCEQCKLAAAASGRRPHADPKALVRLLLEGVVSDRVLEAPNSLVSGDLAQWVTRAKVQRLHRTFPHWTARVNECMVDDGSVFVRFDVEFDDAFGIIGTPVTASKSGQAAIFRVTENLLSDVRPIVDDFGLWDESRTHWPSAQSRPHPQQHDRMETAS